MLFQTLPTLSPDDDMSSFRQTIDVFDFREKKFVTSRQSRLIHDAVRERLEREPALCAEGARQSAQIALVPVQILFYPTLKRTERQEGRGRTLMIEHGRVVGGDGRRCRRRCRRCWRRRNGKRRRAHFAVVPLFPVVTLANLPAVLGRLASRALFDGGLR